MTAQILQFPRKPRLAIDQVFDDLDSFGRLMRNDPYANTPAEFEPRENNLWPDGTRIVTTLETRDRDA